MVDKTSSIHAVKPNMHEAQSFGLPEIASASKGSEGGLSIGAKSGARHELNTDARTSPIHQQQ